MKTSIGNGWFIEHNPKPIPDRSYDWDFWHDNYYGTNGLCGTAASREDALEQIYDMEEWLIEELQ